MPQMDGWAVLSALKADPELKNIPVIMMTITEDRKLGFSLGAADFLTKPVDHADLRAAVTRLIGGGPGNILVIDDDDAIRAVVRLVMEQDGWTVSEAENGRRALDIIDEAEPGVIVLDLMMPEMDGFEFLSAIKHMDRWRSVPVIVVTAKTLTEEDNDRLRGNVEGILKKDEMPIEDLLAEITRILGDHPRARRSSER